MRTLYFLSTVLVVLSVTYGEEPIPTPEHCLLDVEAGCCIGQIPRWFYNRERQRCDQFKYTGCLGNENNFETYSDCMNECVYAVPDIEEKIEEELLEEEVEGEEI